MNAFPISVLSVCAVLIAWAPGAAVVSSEEDTFLQFHQAVDAYVEIHRRLELQAPPLRAETGAYEIIASSDALAKAVQAARVTAREGDLFAAEEADAFRALITRALQANAFTVENLAAATREEVPADAPLPVVNGRFPWTRGAAMWPCVLLALPPLPEELQYRIVGRDLVLVDVHANLVVDILREALR